MLLVHLGCYNKQNATHWVPSQLQKFIAYSSGGYKSKIRLLAWLGKALLWVTDLLFHYMAEKSKGDLWDLF